MPAAGTQVGPAVTAGGLLPAPVAVGVAVVGGACLAVQGVVNGGLAHRLGTPIVAALVSNGLATVLLLAAAVAFRPVRDGLRRLRAERSRGTGPRRDGSAGDGPGGRLRSWQYLGGICGAAFVAGSALTVPVLGVALVSVIQVCGMTVGGIATDRAGLGPAGRLPVTAVRVASALLAMAAVAVTQLGRPVGQLALGLVGLVLLLGLGLSVQSALNGRVNLVARNVGSASLVNAVVGTAALTLTAAAFGAVGQLHPHAPGGAWWLYLGGALSLIVTGTNLAAVRTLGVLRTGLAVIAGQVVAGLILDSLVPGAARPSAALLVGAALTIGAVLLSGLLSGTRLGRRSGKGPDSRA